MALKTADADLLVLDVDEVETAGLSIADLTRGTSKRVLSYLSIGEAESYRGYWRPGWGPGAPAWIDSENPDWANNFRVCYWHEAWRALMIDAVRRIAAAGFHGVYLDTVDTYRHYEALGFDDARERMVALVLDLSAVGRSLDPDFLVVVQNATPLLRRQAYLDAIDGVASEDTFFYDDTRQPPGQVRAVVADLMRARDNGQFVLTVEYGRRPTTVHKWCYRARRLGFVPFVAPRSLKATGPETPQCRSSHVANAR